jgi:hypothetical protein
MNVFERVMTVSDRFCFKTVLKSLEIVKDAHENGHANFGHRSTYIRDRLIGHVTLCENKRER